MVECAGVDGWGGGGDGGGFGEGEECLDVAVIDSKLDLFWSDELLNGIPPV